MSSLKLVQDIALRRALGDRCLGKVTLAATGGATATIASTGATIYTVNGIAYTAAALSAQSIAVTHSLKGALVADGPAAYVQPALSTVYYLVCRNAAGTVAIVQGGYNGQSITLPAGIVEVSQGGLPDVPLNYAPLGFFKVALANAATFTPGTTNLNATDVTATFYDCALLPTTNP